jgi:RHS repeat-associated protein
VTNSNTGYSESYTYDANGSTRTVTTLTGGVSSVTTDTWDLQGRLVHVDQNGAHQIDDTYDDAGNRTSETVDGVKTTFLNDPNQAYDQVLEEYAPGGVLAATYERGMDLLFQDRAGVRSYYAKDGLGSTRALTNSAGAVTDTYTYDASGDLTGSTGTTTNEFLFAGYQNDAALGEEYLRARYLDTAAGRFTSRDTVDGSLNDPVTQNHYIYANGDPVNRYDPSGHETEVEAITVSGITTTWAGITLGPLANVGTNAVLRIAILLGQVQYVWIPRVQFWLTIASGVTLFADEASKSWSNYFGNPESPNDIGRGNLLEDAANQNLTRSSKGFDNWEASRGIGTQLKTHNADTPDKLITAIRGDLNALENKTNFRPFRIDYRSGMSDVLSPKQVNGRVLMVGVPWNSMSFLSQPGFRQSVSNLIQGYDKLKVEIRVIPIPGWRR